VVAFTGPPDGASALKTATPKLSKTHILLVEDERELRDLLALGLRPARYAVELAATAADAHQLLQQKRYALVIADWRLPDGNGILGRHGCQAPRQDDHYQRQCRYSAGRCRGRAWATDQTYIDLRSGGGGAAQDRQSQFLNSRRQP
jgi:CheY-like chemotaxis protein